MLNASDKPPDQPSRCRTLSSWAKPSAMFKAFSTFRNRGAASTPALQQIETFQLWKAACLQILCRRVLNHKRFVALKSASEWTRRASFSDRTCWRVLLCFLKRLNPSSTSSLLGCYVRNKTVAQFSAMFLFRVTFAVCSSFASRYVSLHTLRQSMQRNVSLFWHFVTFIRIRFAEHESYVCLPSFWGPEESLWERSWQKLSPRYAGTNSDLLKEYGRFCSVLFWTSSSRDWRLGGCPAKIVCSSDLLFSSFSPF